MSTAIRWAASSSRNCWPCIPSASSRPRTAARACPKSRRHYRRASAGRQARARSAGSRGQRKTLRGNPDRDDEALAAVRQYPWKPGERGAIDLTKIKIPVLAINGEFDGPNAKTHRMQRELADFTAVVLPGKSHLTAIMAGYIPQLYIDSLVEFIDANDRSNGQPSAMEGAAAPLRQRSIARAGGSTMSEVHRIAKQLQRTLSGPAFHGPGRRRGARRRDGQDGRGQSPAGCTSIWQIVPHMTFWQDTVRRWLQAATRTRPDEEDWPAVTDTSEAAWQRDARTVASGNRAAARRGDGARRGAARGADFRGHAEGLCRRCTASSSTMSTTPARSPC